MKESGTVEDSPLFSGLAPETRRALGRAAVVRSAPAGTTLFSAGTPARGLILILRGTVRVVGERQGRQHLVHQSGPGETLGEVPLFAGGGYPATAIAHADCSYAIFPPEALAGVVQRDAQVALLLLGRLARRVRDLVSRLERNTAWSVESRLAEILLTRQLEAGPLHSGSASPRRRWRRRSAPCGRWWCEPSRPSAARDSSPVSGEGGIGSGMRKGCSAW